MECISDIEHLQLIGCGTVSDAEHFYPDFPIEKDDRFTPAFNEHSVLESQLESANIRNVTQFIESSTIDRIFSNSANLNSEAIVFFVKHLCEVSSTELSAPNNSRIFSLQKIVEITYYNMGRIRLVWFSIWRLLSEHFSMAGCHSNPNISIYAINSLRQLACKFLEKDELSNFQFQTQFLKPFEVIMSSNQSYRIREIVVQCLLKIIQSRANNVKSG